MGAKSWLRCGGIVAAALGAGTLAIGSLVKAQQAGETAAPPVPPPAASSAKSSEPPAAAETPSLPAEPSDQTDAEAADSSAPSSAAPPKPVVPLKRPKYAVAILQALDKVTAETERFEAPLNTPIRYKTLIFIVRACETTAADENIVDAAAHVEVISQPKAPQGGRAPPAREVFKGWMFANSPGLNLLQHPVYDAWLIACKTEIPSA